MKVENIENWPIGAGWALQQTKFKLVTDKDPTPENMKDWFKFRDPRKINVVLFANPRTLKVLDEQVPTTDITYKQYILMRGIVKKVIEDYDGLTNDGEAYIFRV